MDEESIVSGISRTQVENFAGADPRCRVLQLPDGILLRYNLSRALYFYLRTGVRDGRILTRVFASDSPYDRQKTCIGEVGTPLFDPQADWQQLEKVRRLLRDWVEFVRDDSDSPEDFRAFAIPDRPQ
jgi:hypothetical protein